MGRVLGQKQSTLKGPVCDVRGVSVGVQFSFDLSSKLTKSVNFRVIATILAVTCG